MVQVLCHDICEEAEQTLLDFLSLLVYGNEDTFGGTLVCSGPWSDCLDCGEPRDEAGVPGVCATWHTGSS